MKKILIVDDEVDIVAIVAVRLKKLGYEIVTAYDGKAGFDTAKKQKPDLILLDIRLPIMDGYEVCAKLRADDELKDIPVIFLTASTADKVGDKYKTYGAQDFLIKPFDPNELLEKIQRIIL